MPESGQACRGSQFPRSALLAAGRVEGLAEAGFGGGCLVGRLGEQAIDRLLDPMGDVRRLIPVGLPEFVGRAEAAEIPIGVVTAFVGAPFFLFVLRSRRAQSGV